MKVVAAYMLATLGGNANPSADDLKKILGSVGADADGHRIELLLSQLKGKSIAEVVASGKEKLASVPSRATVAVAAPASGTAAAAAPAPSDERVEEKVEEEEDDPDLGDIFGNAFD